MMKICDGYCYEPMGLVIIRCQLPKGHKGEHRATQGTEWIGGSLAHPISCSELRKFKWGDEK